MTKFIKKATNGRYDIYVTLYDSKLFPFYEWDATLNKVEGLKTIVADAIEHYKVVSCYNQRGEGDKLKYKPKYAKIFTVPSYNTKIINTNGKEVENMVLSHFKECKCYWG